MFKVWVLAAGESTWATNGLEFESQAEGELWARDLMGRWFGAIAWAVVPLDAGTNGFMTQEWVDQNAVVTGR